MSGHLPSEQKNVAHHFLAGGGDMGARMRSFDWNATSLGPPETWPQSLKTIVRMMLDSRYAMWMLWGPEYTFFCNDAYLPTVGIKRDWVLGARSDVVWEEVWSEVVPRLERVLQRGESTWDEALQLFLERSGFCEETYHTFSYSPIYDDDNQIKGMLCVVTEVTDRVIGERRLHALRDLAARAAATETVEQSCARLCGVLDDYPYDVAFAAIYLIEKTTNSARRVAASSGLDEHIAPRIVDTGTPTPWPLATLIATAAVQENDLNAANIRMRSPLWPDAVTKALLVPFKDSGQSTLAGFVLAGISPRRPLDDDYRSFLQLIANQTGASIAEAEAYAAERRRVQALAELDRAKTAFFSNVSHEFRTPLTLMLAPLETLLTESDIAPAVRGQLELAHRNSLRLLKLVNSLLDFSRVEAGRVNARFEPADFSAFTRDVASTFRSAIENAGLLFIVDCDDLPQPVYIDRDMWEKIILNLLSNAFKFTLRGAIEIRLRAQAKHAVLEVEDTGAGIPADALPRLFERFYRVEKTQSRTHEGTGIGLALVRELVELHGAGIEVTSELGAGSLFRIAIPFGHRHLPDDKIIDAAMTAPAPQHAREFVEEALRWLPDAHMDSSIDGDAVPQADRRFEKTFGARVLVVDDNADMRAYMRGLLSAFYQVETLSDGVEAFTSARRLRPDLILSDVMMPNLDGFGLLAELRADKKLRDVPVILLSARAGEEARIEGFDAGADDYLAKPFSSRELLMRVGALLELTHTRRDSDSRLRAMLLSSQTREAQFETLLSEAPIGIFLLDKTFCICEINPAGYAAFNDIETVIGADFADIIRSQWNSEQAEKIIAAFRHTLETGEPYHVPELSDKRRDRGIVESYEWQIHRIPFLNGDYGVVCYFRDISAHIEAHRVLLEQQQQLRMADRQKDQFLAMLAHELRNPLAPIGNATELLSYLIEPDASAQAAIQMIKRQMVHLTRLVDDLLDVSRITQGRIELQLDTIDIAQVITQAVETVEPLLRAKNQILVMRSTYPLPMRVEGDITRLIQCLVNILTNAIKYTDESSEIMLNARVDADEAVIEIADKGAGIPQELLPHIFDLFVQGERTLDRSEGGLGIGLSVVKGLIEMHGGTVEAFSSGSGYGATFTMRLPLSKKNGAPVPEREPLQTSAKKILIVDDNADAVQSLAVLLTLTGYTIKTASDGHEALRQLETFTPDIAILDIGLPGMDGYELAAAIRVLPSSAKIKLIALTGYGQAGDREKAQQAGFDRHLVKPVEFDSLRQSLEGF